MGERPVIVVKEKAASGCMTALWMLMLLGAMAMGGCFLVGKCAQAMTEERDPEIDLEAVDQQQGQCFGEDVDEAPETEQ